MHSVTWILSHLERLAALSAQSPVEFVQKAIGTTSSLSLLVRSFIIRLAAVNGWDPRAITPSMSNSIPKSTYQKKYKNKPTCCGVVYLHTSFMRQFSNGWCCYLIVCLTMPIRRNCKSKPKTLDWKSWDHLLCHVPSSYESKLGAHNVSSCFSVFCMAVPGNFRNRSWFFTGAGWFGVGT